MRFTRNGGARLFLPIDYSFRTTISRRNAPPSECDPAGYARWCWAKAGTDSYTNPARGYYGRGYIMVGLNVLVKICTVYADGPQLYRAMNQSRILLDTRLGTRLTRELKDGFVILFDNGNRERYLRLFITRHP